MAEPFRPVVFESTPLSRAWLANGGLRLGRIPLGLNQCSTCGGQYITAGQPDFYPCFCPYCGTRFERTAVIDNDTMRADLAADEDQESEP